MLLPLHGHLLQFYNNNNNNNNNNNANTLQFLKLRRMIMRIRYLVKSKFMKEGINLKSDDQQQQVWNSDHLYLRIAQQCTKRLRKKVFISSSYESSSNVFQVYFVKVIECISQ